MCIEQCDTVDDDLMTTNDMPKIDQAVTFIVIVYDVMNYIYSKLRCLICITKN